MKLPVPADVPRHRKNDFINAVNTITKNTKYLAMFSADQKIEHGNSVSPDKLFSIASAGHMGAFATHLGLIYRYAQHYEHINYIVKMNGKTDLQDIKSTDPYSKALWSFEQVINARQQHLPIYGIGYTVYLGSEYEPAMLQEASTLVYQAHQEGMVAVIWMYPRGGTVTDESDPEIISKAAAVGPSIGADCIKVKTPHGDIQQSAEHLGHITAAAGNTRVICSGGAKRDAYRFLHELYTQMHTGMSAGCAVGRNIFQRDIGQAVAITKAIASIVYDGNDHDSAYEYIQT